MRKRMYALSAGLVAVGAATLGLALPAGASANGNIALAVATPWQKTVVRTSIQTNNDPAGIIHDANRAAAGSAGCFGCKAVALAVQVDLAAGPVISTYASNVATSATGGGGNDDVSANAYQFIIAPDSQVVFTPQCRISITGIEANAVSIANSTENGTQISSDVGAQMDSLLGVLTDPSCYTNGTPSPVPVHVTFNQFSLP